MSDLSARLVARWQGETEGGAGMRLVIRRELKSPNKWQGHHWRIKHRETIEWERAVWAQHAIVNGTAAALRSVEAALRRHVPACRSRVIVTRLVPSRRNFIKDDDNLRFSTKPLNDALKRLGLIHDDNRKWLDQPMPTQEVSTSGGWATVIEIDPVEG